jgi:chromosome segregation ATPase
MNTWVLENWFALMGLISAPLAYFFGGKQKMKSDAVSSMQEMYASFLDDYKVRIEDMGKEIIINRESSKELQSHFNTLQNNFNDLYIKYSHEVQKNIDWAKMYNDLKTKYEVLEKQYEDLKKNIEEYKKSTKPKTK